MPFSLTLALLLYTAVPRADSVLRIGVLHTPGSVVDSAALRGITLGVEEAERTGSLFHWSVVLVMVANTREAADMILAGTAQADCAALQQPQTNVILNIGCRAPDLRNSATHPMVFSVEAPSSEYESRGATLLWHGALERFGAGQLNERYRRRFGEPMTSSAWAGWFAVKVALETAMRAATRAPATVAATLTGDQLQFDGHKGVALRFSKATHQLEQPLYVLRNGMPEEAR